MSVTAFEYAARQFETKTRPWATPGAMTAVIDPTYRHTPALDIIDRELVELADGDNDRLMIFMSPQEGKSQKVSRRFPAWLLAHDPTLRIAIVSFAANKAERWGKALLRDIRRTPQLAARIELAPDSQTAQKFETTAGGGVICVGIEGGITGEPVDVLIVDDPVRGRAEAESATYREDAWDWWESNGSTRLSERGKVIVMMTRWHEDDLAGRLQVREPGEWRVVSIPAIAVSTDDPLGREPGEEMPSARDRKPGYFHKLKSLRSAYVFSSIYQQSPVPAEGGLFKRDRFRFWRPIPVDQVGRSRVDLDGRTVTLDDCWRFVTVDLAASVKTSADWTVAACWALTLDADLVLLDRVRARIGEQDHWDLVRPLRARWGADTVFVESRMFGTTLVYEAGRHGVPVQELKADTDKITRALPAADRVNTGRLWVPAERAWLDEYLDEMCSFPTAAHDDQVDVTAYAARVAAAHWVPTTTEPATTSVFDGPDFMALAYE